MSALKMSLVEGKIVFSDKIQPKKFTKEGGDFAYLRFTFCNIKSRKVKGTDNFDSKTMFFSGRIRDEKQADRFLSRLDTSKRNYITITDANLADFDVEKINKTNGSREYSIDAYYNIQFNVNEFTITHKEQAEKHETNGTQDSKGNQSANYDETHDEVPF